MIPVQILNPLSIDLNGIIAAAGIKGGHGLQLTQNKNRMTLFQVFIALKGLVRPNNDTDETRLSFGENA